MKVDIDLVKFVLQRKGLALDTIADVLETINVELGAQDAENPLRERIKKQAVILLSGEDTTRPEVGWVLQIPESDSPYKAIDRLIKSAYEFNTTPKGRRMPVRTIGETCEVVSTRITKEHGLWIQTREPVIVVCAPNRIPMGAV